MKARRITFAVGPLLGALCWLGLSAIFAPVWRARAQNPAPQEPAAAAGVVKTEAKSVPVEVVVTDKKGDPVRDLQQNNFRVYEDDKEQTVTSFSRVSASSPGEGAGPPRYLVLFFDDTSLDTGYQMKIRKETVEFLQEAPSKGRLIALMDFLDGLRATQTFTSDAELLKRAVASVQIASGLAHEVGQNPAFDARRLLVALRTVITPMGTVNGPKALVFFSSGFPLAPENESEMNATLAAANQAQVPIYTLESGTPPEVLETLASRTGGFTVANITNFAPELTKIASNLDEYYLLGYVPANPANDGRYHRIRVEVDRKGVKVRGTAGYFAAKGTDPLAGKPEGKLLEERALSPQPGDVPVSLRAVQTYSSADMARVNVALDIPANSLNVEKLKGKFHSEVNILGIASREDGSVAARFSDAVNLDFEKPQWEQFAKGRFRYYNTFNLASGKYVLRVVLDAGGQKFGKYEAPVTIEPYNGQRFHLSEVALSNKAGLILASNYRFKRTEQVSLYVEVNAPQLLSPAPPILGIVMTIIDPKTNQQVYNSNTIRLNSMAQPGNSVVPVGLTLPIAKLPAGDYRVEVQARDSRGQVSVLRKTEFTLED